MFDWATLIKKYLPDAEAQAIEFLVGYLEKNVGYAAANQLGPAYGRLLAKGIDGVAKVTAKLVQRGDLTADAAQGLVVAYVRASNAARAELGAAEEVYAPLTLAVELAKNPPKGTDPAEAAKSLAAAREKRKAALLTMRADVQDYLKTIFSGD